MEDSHAMLLAPDRIGEVQDLKPQGSGAVKLTHESQVLCINRGRDVLTDMFNSRPYEIQPGFFVTEYGAARHFQLRAVVPGSRNPETGFQASFIAIIGIAIPTKDGLKVVLQVDDLVQWDPFTDEECRQYGHALEALDREALTDPIEPNVEIKSLHGSGIPAAGGAPSRVKSGGGTPTTRGRRNEIAGPGVEALKTKNRPGQNDATREIREATARSTGGAGGDEE